MDIEYDKLNQSEYLKIAIPFMLSTLTQPLLGIVDTAVVGRMESPIFIGGVSIGVTIFNTLYWLFGFLRVSTTSYSAQSIGSGNPKEKVESFIHPFIIAITVGLVFILMKDIIWIFAMKILAPERLVMDQSHIYYNILIYGAPIVFVNYVILGWLMGQSKVKESVIIQVVGNIVNIVLDILLVWNFGMRVNGVAIATLFSQIFTLVLGIKFMFSSSGFKCKDILNKNILDKKEILKKILLNSDFIIRTICLLIVNNMFMATSSSFGTEVLAANTIILQLESVISYLFEGLANASSVFAGKAVGNKNSSLLRNTIKITFKWSFIFMILLTILYILFRDMSIFLFTSIEEVIINVKIYDFWIVIYPCIACMGLTFYGVFTGAMETKAIRNSTFLSMMLFIITLKITVPIFKNHGLWFAFLTYYFGRTVFLLIYLRKLNSDVKEKAAI